MSDLAAKHLELVQAVIGRLANHSFVLKGWSVTLAAGLFALAARDADRTIALIALLPTLSFWGLDAYYLRQERLFRELYADVARRLSGTVTPVDPFSLNTILYEGRVDSWKRTLFSRSVFGVHAVVLATILAASRVV